MNIKKGDAAEALRILRFARDHGPGIDFKHKASSRTVRIATLCFVNGALDGNLRNAGITLKGIRAIKRLEKA